MRRLVRQTSASASRLPAAQSISSSKGLKLINDSYEQV